MSTKITAKLLTALCACPRGIARFDDIFPDGASWFDTKAKYIAAGDKRSLTDLAWFVQVCPDIIPELNFAERLSCQLKRCDPMELVLRCPPSVIGASYANRLAAITQDDANRDIFARMCPAKVEGSTWEARLATVHTSSARTLLGLYCPAGVKGATFSARLALMRNDGDRARLISVCDATVEGATWEARIAAMGADEKVRFELACWCPVEVAGSTWEARLALIEMPEQRIWFAVNGNVNIEGATFEKRANILKDHPELIDKLRLKYGVEPAE